MKDYRRSISAKRLGLAIQVLTPESRFAFFDQNPSRMTVTVDEAGRVIESEAY